MLWNVIERIHSQRFYILKSSRDCGSNLTSIIDDDGPIVLRTEYIDRIIIL